MKGKVIKELHSLGVRKAEKRGVGHVNLSHLRTADLINLLAKTKEEKT